MAHSVMYAKYVDNVRTYIICISKSYILPDTTNDDRCARVQVFVFARISGSRYKIGYLLVLVEVESWTYLSTYLLTFTTTYYLIGKVSELIAKGFSTEYK
jgi:hypothetical protein